MSESKNGSQGRKGGEREATRTATMLYATAKSVPVLRSGKNCEWTLANRDSFLNPWGGNDVA
jgi:hypothetical protein